MLATSLNLILPQMQKRAIGSESPLGLFSLPKDRRWANTPLMFSTMSMRQVGLGNKPSRPVACKVVPSPLNCYKHPILESD